MNKTPENSVKCSVGISYRLGNLINMPVGIDQQPLGFVNFAIGYIIEKRHTCFFLEHAA